jgi:hypothetical protein
MPFQSRRRSCGEAKGIRADVETHLSADIRCLCEGSPVFSASKSQFLGLVTSRFLQDSAAAKFLASKGVDRKDFNSYGSRRGNDEVMARGTFANVRIINKVSPFTASSVLLPAVYQFEVTGSLVPALSWGFFCRQHRLCMKCFWNLLVGYCAVFEAALLSSI